MLKSTTSLVMPGRDAVEEQICYRQSAGKCRLQRDLLISSPFAEA